MLLRLWFLVLCVLAGAFASPRADARAAANHARQNEVAGQKLAPGVFESEAAILRQAAAMQAAELQQAKSGRGYDFASGCCLAAERIPGPYRGGPHSKMKGPSRDGFDSHHMPDRNADPRFSAEDGPAIQMDPRDHWKTSSNGRNGRAGEIYRQTTADMIAAGRYRDAMAREIWDVRRAAAKGSGDATKYNEAISEMLEYARGSGQLPINPRTGR